MTGSEHDDFAGAAPGEVSGCRQLSEASRKQQLGKRVMGWPDLELEVKKFRSKESGLKEETRTELQKNAR